MRIALLSETYFPHINGVTTHVKTLKEGFEALGHEVLVVTATPDTRKHYIENGVLYCPAKRIKKIYGYGLAYPYSRTRLKILKEFNPDIIHVHNEYGIGLFGIYAAKKLKSTLVYTLHTAYDDYMYYVMPKVLAHTAGKIMQKYIGYYAKKANAIIGPSPKCFEYIRKASHKKKIRILPNSIEREMFTPNKIDKSKVEELRNKLGIPNNAYVACFVGRMGQEKSVEVTLEYLAKTTKKEDNIFFIAIGDGPEREALIEYSKKLNIFDRVIFTGRVEHEDLPLYYAMSKLYLTSSLSEMNSISMLEAMSMGLPVLQRMDETNKEQIMEGINGYIFYNEKDMYRHLNRLSSMTEEEYDKLKFSVEDTVSQRDEGEIARKALLTYEKAIERGTRQKNLRRKNRKKMMRKLNVVKNVKNKVSNTIINIKQNKKGKVSKK